MRRNHPWIFIIILTVLAVGGCNFLGGPPETFSPEASPTIYIQTLSALQTRAVMTATAQGVAGGLTPVPMNPIPNTGGTPGQQGAAVINDTLCWRGPGPAYEVISAIFKGTQVQLLGRGVIPNWLIIRNPVYLDACWVQASDLAINPGVDINALPVFAVPATPTMTSMPTATPTTAVPGIVSPVPSATLIVPSPTTAPTLPAPSDTPAPLPTPTSPPPSPTP